jgi:hypothetical protein
MSRALVVAVLPLVSFMVNASRATLALPNVDAAARPGPLVAKHQLAALEEAAFWRRTFERFEVAHVLSVFPERRDCPNM